MPNHPKPSGRFDGITKVKSQGRTGRRNPGSSTIAVIIFTLSPFNARFRASVQVRGGEHLLDLLLGLHLVGFVVCAATVQRRPAEIALLWPIAILIIFVALAIAAVDPVLGENGANDEP